MRDEDDAHALGLEALDDVHQPRRLGESQARGGLVQDEQRVEING